MSQKSPYDELEISASFPNLPTDKVLILHTLALLWEFTDACRGSLNLTILMKIWSAKRDLSVS